MRTMRMISPVSCSCPPFVLLFAALLLTLATVVEYFFIAQSVVQRLCAPVGGILPKSQRACRRNVTLPSANASTGLGKPASIQSLTNTSFTGAASTSTDHWGK